MCLMFRIVWNGNHFGANGTASTDTQRDAITPAFEYMVENGTAVVNTGKNGTTQYSILDFVGYVTTPTSGYTESGLGGESARFHGPFQRWMTQGASTSSSKTKKVGRRVHMLRYGVCRCLISALVVIVTAHFAVARCSGSFIVLRTSRRSASAISMFTAERTIRCSRTMCPSLWETKKSNIHFTTTTVVTAETPFRSTPPPRTMPETLSRSPLFSPSPTLRCLPARIKTSSRRPTRSMYRINTRPLSIALTAYWSISTQI